MKTYLAHIMVEIDAETVGLMLETLQTLTKSVLEPAGVRVTGFKFDRPKDEKELMADIRGGNWKQFGIKSKP